MSFHGAISIEGFRLARNGVTYSYAEYVDWYGHAALRCWLESPPALQSPAKMSAASDAQELPVSGTAVAWEKFCAKHKPEIVKHVQQCISHRQQCSKARAASPTVIWVNSPRASRTSHLTHAAEAAMPACTDMHLPTTHARPARDPPP
jgi:hypothetical protein